MSHFTCCVLACECPSFKLTLVDMNSFLNELVMPYSAVYITVGFVLLMHFLSVVLKTRFGRSAYALCKSANNSNLIPHTKFGDNENESVGRSPLKDTSNKVKATRVSIHFTGKHSLDTPFSSSHSVDPPPPPKRSRKMNSEHKCGSCSIWLQSGSIKELERYHNMHSTKHPNEHASAFSLFTSMGGMYDINLRPDNCICDACYRDCKRSVCKPRWYKLKQELITKHCFLCCVGTNTCSCSDICDWGATNWHEGKKIDSDCAVP